ncbi:MAG: EAL domain-containing protein [Azoarcus sp.]|jgi:diguanylate cyclase (GGDEF)-like protein/PAS domain S-box-containing protein|nr:EAL domain-containing protein [Azoarcus sp.]
MTAAPPSAQNTAAPLSEEPSAAPSGATPKQILSGIWRNLILVTIMASGLFWVFMNADIVQTSELQAYSQVLREFRRLDTLTNTDILSIRFNLHKNYDTISQDISQSEILLKQLHATPTFLSAVDAENIKRLIAELDRQQQAKGNLIETFIRESAILRNSTNYFPTSIREFVRLDTPAHLRDALRFLSNDVMTFMVSDDDALLSDISTRTQSIAAQSASLPPLLAHKLNNVLEHAKIMTNGRRGEDSILYDILLIPTGSSLEKITYAYNVGHQRAADRSRIYRVVLFGSALALAIYLMLLFVRLGRTSQALHHANAHLEQRIDELRKTQTSLKLYATLFNSAAEGMTITDAHTRILVVNPAFTAITGYKNEEAQSDTPALLASGRHDTAFYANMWKSLGQHGKWQGEIWNRRKSGETYPSWLSISAVHDHNGAATHYIGVFFDITERKKSEAHIQHLSLHDALTNLPNRLLMQEKLNEALIQSQRLGSHTGVLFVNIDRFRNVNDTLGNELGDALLQQIAKRCLTMLRDTDTVSRLNSDEFVFILPDINQPHDAAVIARKLLASISRPYLLGGHDITITASIGIVLSGTDGNTPAELLRNADAAMSRAKEDGRNNFRFYSADMNISTIGDLLLENQLRNAIQHNELELFYQPKIDAATGILQGAEALIRWRHPEQGLLLPGRFIRLAEDSGLIIPIGAWVLRAVCQQIRTWRSAGLPVVPIAVNLSAQQFLQNDLPSVISGSLKAAKIDPEMLELELTESMLMRNIERTIETLSRLRKMGVSIAIDDFGTGYSSLSYLKQFQVGCLKIDKSFVAGIQDNRSDGMIAIAVIELAHALNLKVVAEGVETEEQRSFLLNHNCDIFQGYLFSYPLPASEFAQKLAYLKETAPEA